ncbi:hypothetical protein CCACVL1_07978 [Corchorus capsularis]|uniref:Uncharacterized protein n=1 Tax=Corchorus capsularis TaxID=210143 RepID=A0A1R3J309_COCAP|nr:hypothetical protein CCACVL1_07978 [Corchorus capsularis]
MAGCSRLTAFTSCTLLPVFTGSPRPIALTHVLRTSIERKGQRIEKEKAMRKEWEAN